MGLDTVELIWAFERYFSIDFPDAVAEQTYTVGDVATYVAQRLGVAGRRESAVRAAVSEQLRSLLPAANEAAPLHQLLAGAEAVLKLRLILRQHYGLQLPPLAAPPTAGAPPSLWERLWGRPLFAPPAWPGRSLAELIDWVVALNYQKLLVPPLASQYEVEQAVIGMTHDQSGVPVEEIHLGSRFVSDLGMD